MLLTVGAGRGDWTFFLYLLYFLSPSLAGPRSAIGRALDS